MRVKLKLGSKGVTIWDLSSLAFTLVFITVTVATGVWVNQQLTSTSFPSETMNQSITIGTSDNNTWKDLGYRAESVAYVRNDTAAVSTDWPKKSEGGAAYWTTRDYEYITQIIFYCNDSVEFACNVSTDWNVTYSAFNSTAHQVTMNATKGIFNLAQWLPIIMVVFAAAIVIAALAVWFGTRR